MKSFNPETVARRMREWHRSGQLLVGLHDDTIGVIMES